MAKKIKHKDPGHGGNRENSGRKKGVTFKEPTKPVRIPLSKISTVKKLITFDAVVLKNVLKKILEEQIENI